MHIQTHICNVNIEEKLNPVPDKFTWKEDSQILFQQALNSNDIQNRIKLFMKKDFDKTDSQNAAADFSNIIKDAATMSLKSNRKTQAGNNRNNKKRTKNLKWYDFSLQKARLVLKNKENLFRKFSNVPYSRSSFYKTLKEFRKLRKQKLRQYRQGILNKLDSMCENNPSLYWKLLDELKNSDNVNKSEAISSSDWIKHFSSLNEQKKTLQILRF